MRGVKLLINHISHQENTVSWSWCYPTEMRTWSQHLCSWPSWCVSHEQSAIGFPLKWQGTCLVTVRYSKYCYPVTPHLFLQESLETLGDYCRLLILGWKPQNMEVFQYRTHNLVDETRNSQGGLLQHPWNQVGHPQDSPAKRGSPKVEALKPSMIIISPTKVARNWGAWVTAKQY